jgi:hypothetical protein
MEIRPSLGGTGRLTGLVCLALVICGVSTWLIWDQNFIVAGVLLVPCAILAVALGVLIFRLVLRPVMLRLTDKGLYLRRLGTVIPWEALSHIERIDQNGTDLFVLVERAGGDPVFKTGNVAKGAAANDLAGLPALPVSLTGLHIDAEDFAAALESMSGLDIRRP